MSSPTSGEIQYNMQRSQFIEEHSDKGYWGEYAKYPVSDWKHEVANNDTRESYWDWVMVKVDEEECEHADTQDEADDQKDATSDTEG